VYRYMHTLPHYAWGGHPINITQLPQGAHEVKLSHRVMINISRETIP
jgi:hypothetical protein